MDKHDFIRKAIYDNTVVRDAIFNNAATSQYYDDLLEALSVDNFPLLEVNTISKRTYMVKTSIDNNCYLVFDHYLLENIYSLNQFVLHPKEPEYLEAYYCKAMAEECYLRNKYFLSIQFAGDYFNNIEWVIKHYKEEQSDNQADECLFIQQAFLIAHELFHFILDQDSSLYSVGIAAKKHFFESICNYLSPKDNITESLIQKAINNTDFLEECLCDSTGIIQTIDVATKLKRMSEVDAALSALLAIMDQFTISTIKDAVRKSGNVSYDDAMNRFSTRILHFKAYTSQYIKDLSEDGNSNSFQQRVEKLYGSWLKNVQYPILEKLVSSAEELKVEREVANCDSEELKRSKKILKQIFNS